MYYSDFTDIFKDDFTGLQFGTMEVLGWISKTKSGKKYLVECSVCKEDPQLHGDGLYTIDKPNLIKGVIPCACAKIFRWSDEQWIIKLERASEESKTKFLRYVGGIGHKRSAVFYCDEHGEYETGVYNFISGKGCRRCAANNLKPDDKMISSFMQSGSFSEGTQFTRTKRKDSKGAKVYWKVDCSECGVTYESNSCHLRKGKQGCDCSIRNQKFSYLLQILDEETPVAIKFGITKAPKRRLAEHQNCSSFIVEPIAYWKFDDNLSCKAAELNCLQSLNCGVLSENDFPDGYTETTYISNIEAIMGIFSSHGGEIIYDYH